MKTPKTFLALTLLITSFSFGQNNTFPTPSGNVGIGTTTPVQKLEVVGSISLGSGSVNSNTTKLFLKNPVGKTWALSSGSNMITENYFSIYNWTDNQTTPFFTLSDNGNIGIGTTFPTAKLQVIGNISVQGHGHFEANTDFGGAIALTNSSKTGSGAANQWQIYNMTGPYGNGLNFWAYGNNGYNNGSKVTFLDNGNVGIGTATPTANLEISKLNSNLLFDVNTDNLCKIVSKGWNANIDIHTFQINGTENVNQLILNTNGKVGIGTQNPDEMLTVNGTVHATKVRVTATVPADYVFQKYYTGKSELKSDYTMPTLAEIESFTKKNNHLPNIPSAKEMQTNGVDLGEMNNLLLQKVEELTLYAIEQYKELKRLKVDNENYKLLAERLTAIELELKK